MPSGAADAGSGDERQARAGFFALAGLAALAGVALLAQAIWPTPWRFVGLTVDRLGAGLALLVAGVGTATYRFSLRYLDGDPARARFLRNLTYTVASAYLLMLATNLVVFFVAWSLTSFGLHRLLTHRADRPEATPPARKKFLISRLGDLALVAAFVEIWRRFDTLDLHAFLARAVEDPGSANGIAFLVALAALTKSAQFPFHSWLPETMEAPTPVSALMHAGVINAGGALLLRFAPALVRAPEALFLLTAIGTATAVLGTLAMWAQVKVKRTLAWSTVSQMGFMMVQCGLGAVGAAFLHIVGHGSYKAWSFLRAGTLPGPAPSSSPANPTRTLTIAGLGTLAGAGGVALATWATGFSLHAPGELALAAVVALSVGQIWVALMATPSVANVASAVLASVAGPTAAFALYTGVGAFLAPSLGALPSPEGPWAWLCAVLPVVALAGLAVAHAYLPTLGATAGGRRFFVHAMHGFYCGAVADRIVAAVWPSADTHDLP